MGIESNLMSRSPIFDALSNPKKFEKQMERFERTEKSAKEALDALTKGKTLKKLEADTKKSVAAMEKELASLKEKLSQASEELAENEKKLGGVIQECNTRKSTAAKMEADAKKLDETAKHNQKQANILFDQAEKAKADADELKQTYEKKLSELSKFLKAMANG